MPAIEKICELSGDYGSYDMYRHKRNHIQIMPEHRKEFRGAHAELVFTKVELQQCRRFRSGVSSQTLYHFDVAEYFDGNVKAWWNEMVYFDGFFHRVEYTYELRVSDPALQGEVSGVYLNWSTKKGDVIRRMKRLIGKNLVIRDEVKLSKKKIIKQWEADLAEQARLQIEENKAA